MMSYPFWPRDQIFVKVYGNLSSAKNIGKNLFKNISKNLSSRYSQKLLHHAKQSETDLLKATFKKSNSKTAEATGDLNGNKTANKI